MRAKFEALLGGRGASTRLARALGYSREHISRIWSGDKAEPETLVAIAELLERLPEEDWPERWQASRQGTAVARR